MRQPNNIYPGLSLLLLVCIFIVTGCNSSPSATSPHATGTPFVPTPIIARPVVSRGCGKASIVPPGSSKTRVIFSDRRTRSYLLHVPKGYKDTVQQPLVLNFHGHGSIAPQQEYYTNFSVLADQDDFLVAYPQGVIGPDRHTGWATGPARNPQVNDVLFVSDLLNELQATLCIDPARIYATGFSNGGGMTYLLACKMDDRIAAFASVSGSYPPAPGGCNPARPVPILEFHGTADNVVPYNGSVAKNYPPVMQWLQEWVRLDGCTTTPLITHPASNVATYQWTGCRSGSIVMHYELLGWPHAWPRIVPVKRTLPTHGSQGHNTSGHNPAPHSPLAASIDATPLIWSFFVMHPLPIGA